MLGVLGCPLDERSVHRTDLAAQLAGAKLGDEVTPELAADVLLSPDGRRNGIPESAEFVVLVSSAGMNRGRSRTLASATEGRVVLWSARSALLELRSNPCWPQRSTKLTRRHHAGEMNTVTYAYRPRDFL